MLPQYLNYNGSSPRLFSLQRADVILYDALVHPVLLEHRKPSAELVFVGKRAGADLIVTYWARELAEWTRR